MNTREHKVLSPTGMLGYGFPEESFHRGMAKEPDLVAVDAGSTDPGPYYLGAGKSFTDRALVKRDLRIILTETLKASIPFIIGSAGGCGSRVHVDWTLAIIREVAQEEKLSFRMGVIYSDIDKKDVLDALAQDRVRPLGPVPQLSEADVRNTVRIVAQMGSEPVSRALDMGPQVVLCGRCYDPVPFAALAIREGFPPGLAYHMGKILECGAIAASPGSGCDCVMGTLCHDHFVLEALNPKRRFTRLSAAAHTLYEKSDPYLLPGPGGAIDLSETVFEPVADGRVKISGTQFISSPQYRVKLEGVAGAGFRTVCVAGVRDPNLVRQIDGVLRAIRQETHDRFGDATSDYGLHFHVYGRNGVMGNLEPDSAPRCHELGLVIEVVAETQGRADTICSFVRSTLLHYSYPGRVSTAGNLALPFSPSETGCGEVYRFSIYHLMDVEHPDSLFPVEIMEAGQ